MKALFQNFDMKGKIYIFNLGLDNSVHQQNFCEYKFIINNVLKHMPVFHVSLF